MLVLGGKKKYIYILYVLCILDINSVFLWSIGSFTSRQQGERQGAYNDTMCRMPSYACMTA